MPESADAIIIGAGLAGLVAACELADAGRTVLLLDQEPAASFGGQAFWSLGGLFLVDSPEQRRLGIRDSRELAFTDWMGTAGFDRPEDRWPRAWASAYVDFAAGEKRAWLRERGITFFPVVGWAERGGYNAIGPGNSMPRFHVAWGTGTGVVKPFAARAVAEPKITLRFRHRVTEVIREGGVVVGVRGEVLEPSGVARGEPSGRARVGDFAFRAQAVIVASGGIGGNPDLVRRNWPARMGTPPKRMVTGVPAHVDGLMLGIAEAAGANLINRDRMWHYTEGVANWAPIWPGHGIRILPGPSSLWLDARGRRLPVPLYPGFDTLGTLRHLRETGFDHSWFVLTKRIIAKEFALSGSEQNPDLTSGSWRQVIQRVRVGVPPPVQAFIDKGEDFVVADDVTTLVARMNARVGEALLDPAEVEVEVRARDAQIDSPFGKDMQITAIRAARRYIGDRVIRAVKPHKLLDPVAGPLIAVRLNVLTRKTLGGLETDLDSRALDANGEAIPGFYAAGEAAGFGGGGMHGYRALEGTFLGGCLFSGRAAGRAAAKAMV
jgi:predicted oxidoreductase